MLGDDSTLLRVFKSIHLPRLFVLFLLATGLLAMGDGTSGLTPQTSNRSAEVRRHLAAGSQFLKNNDLDEAAREFTSVLKLDPRNADAFANLGVISYFQGDLRKASESMRKALAINPSLIKTQALLGICLSRMGDPGSKKILEASFDKLQDKSLRIQVGIVLAGIYESDGDLDASARALRTVLVLDPDNSDVLYSAQRIYSELSDDTLNKLAIVAPGSSRMQQVIAERLINQGDLAGAIIHYHQAIEINPRIPAIHFELAEALLQSAPSDAQSQANAEGELNEVQKLEGANAKSECLFGQIEFLRGDGEAAYSHFERALSLEPGSVQAHLGLARTLMTDQKFADALPHLVAAADKEPLNQEAHFRLAVAYKRLGRMSEAENEERLSNEIKQVKEQVKKLYRQMNYEKSLDEDLTPAP